MNPHLERAVLLVHQSRYELAEKELKQVLSTEPSNAQAHAVLAICHSQQERYDEATKAAELALHLEPDEPMVHYAMSFVFASRRRFEDAEKWAREAIRLNPYAPSYFAWLSRVLLARQQWRPALEAAESGLAIDAEDADCLNCRAMALVKLGRTQDAGHTLEVALARQPDNALSHANMGWTSLEHSDPRQAMLHFREALRLDPENEFARQGLVRALNARNIVYRLLLKYLLWMAKLSPQAQWAVVVGGYLGARMLRKVGDEVPALKPWIVGLLIVYFLFVLLTWLGEPFFNLLLRLHPLGRHALSADQRSAANLLGLGIVAGLSTLVVALVLDRFELILAAAAWALLLIPASAIHRCDKGWPRMTMAAGTAVLFLIAAASIAMMTMARTNLDRGLLERGQSIFAVFVMLVLFATFAANFLTSAVVRR